MEEEIITPEEEVFDYHKIRYILNSDGYVCHASLGGLIVCDIGECTEYNGEVPNGYKTIEEWLDSEIDKLNAWKIVEGNLVFDENKYNELQRKCEKEEEENALATHKWVRNQLGKSSQVVIDEFSNNASGTSLIVLNDSGEYEIPELKVSSEDVESCNVLVSNKNLLGNDAVTQTINGITFTINEDKTIKLNGTATADIELILKGTSNNLDMLFLIQKETNYVVGGLSGGVSLNLYNYDGADKTLIGTYGNEVISLNDSYKVTQTSLVIASGTKFEDIIISPQIEIGKATDYVEHEENKSSATLYNNKVTINDLYSYYPTSIIMADEEVNIEVNYFRYKTLEEQLTSIATTSNEISLSVSSITEDLNSFKTEVAKNQESSQEDIDDIYETLENGVGSVKNALVTINVNGISVATNISKISTLITNNTFAIKSGDTRLAYFGYDEETGKSISEMDNLTIHNYFTSGYHRTEKFEPDGEKRTGVFYVGGDE